MHKRRADGSLYREGDETAKGWKGRKYYLSDEAIALLMEHCRGTPLTMSAFIDDMVKRELGLVIEEGRRQIAELTSEQATVPPMTHTDIREHIVAPVLDPDKSRNLVIKPKRRPGRSKLVYNKATKTIDTVTTEQPAKKDFDLDI